VTLSTVSIHDYRMFFSGNTKAYGVHIPGPAVAHGKREGKNFTKTAEITQDQYVEHLEGRTGLGLIPIRDDNTVSFAVIDVDDYSDHQVVLSTIERNNLPLIPFSSKSGGVHLYLFYETPVRAALAIEHMVQFRRILGFPKTTEIFPKQATLRVDGVGNWINLPYFGEERTIIYANGTTATLEEALVRIGETRVSVSIIKNLFLSLPLADGPPCLQTIYLSRHTDFRNLYLFSLTRYFKSKLGASYESAITNANNELDIPIDFDELNNTVIQSYKKKDYCYKCDDEPLRALCDKEDCQLRAYGVGGQLVSELNYGILRQYLSDPPYYLWTINESELTFNGTKDLMNQDTFRATCLEKLHVLPYKLKDTIWTKIINDALKSMDTVKIEEGDDMSAGATLLGYFREFLTNRAMAENKEQLFIDHVYLDPVMKMYYFRAKNLVNFLHSQKQFRTYSETEIQIRIRRMGAKPGRIRINKDNPSVRVWMIPEEVVRNENMLGVVYRDFKDKEHSDETDF
jgi:hypothetical protein